MIKLTLRRWHTLAALLSVTAFARALPLDAAVSSALDPYEATVFDTATGATCAQAQAASGTTRRIGLAAIDPGAPLAVTSLEIYFISATGQAWEDVRVRAQFWDGLNPSTGGISELPASETREVSLGARQFPARSINVETVRFGQPVTLTSAALHAFSLSLQGRLEGTWIDTDALIPCLRSDAQSGSEKAVQSDDVMDAGGVVMLKVSAAWLSPPPTLPPIPKPTGTPTPVPPPALMAFVPAVQR